VRNGRIGHMIGMITDPAYRPRGYSCAIEHSEEGAGLTRPV
jgi:hypothetical protein